MAEKDPGAGCGLCPRRIFLCREPRSLYLPFVLRHGHGRANAGSRCPPETRFIVPKAYCARNTPCSAPVKVAISPSPALHASVTLLSFKGYFSVIYACHLGSRIRKSLSH